MAESTQRLFLALWPDDAVRDRMAAIAARLALASGRRIPPENLHITLVFLGAIELSRRVGIERAVSGISAAAFDLSLTEMLWRRRNRMVWLSAEPTTPLVHLVNVLQQALTACGVAIEPRPYRPHVTLARDVVRGPARQAIEPIAWTVRDVCLVSSRVTSAGSRYTVERRWNLNLPKENR